MSVKICIHPHNLYTLAYQHYTSSYPIPINIPVMYLSLNVLTPYPITSNVLTPYPIPVMCLPITRLFTGSQEQEAKIFSDGRY